MDYPSYFESKNSSNLFGLRKSVNFLYSLYCKKKLPKVLMLSGNKGTGKSTLINHFLFYIFDKNNYDDVSQSISETSIVYKQFKENIFQNIIYFKGSDLKSIKVDDIRNLKSIIQQTSITDRERFIIFDDIEIFNISCLNALLKIIEEPSRNNHFILINNKTKPLLDTIRSRSLEIKIILSEDERIKIIKELVEFHNIETFLKVKDSNLTPGNFLKFNFILNKHEISLKENILENISLLLNLHKKNKDILFIDILYHLLDFYFKSLKDENNLKNDKIYEIRNFVLDNMNKYLTFNLNQNSLINAINDKLNNG
tara:strand:- start:7136 stop:8071 length:936 start_codon:yes stop_codon:yes gene_type:complete